VVYPDQAMLISGARVLSQMNTPAEHFRFGVQAPRNPVAFRRRATTQRQSGVEDTKGINT